MKVSELIELLKKAPADAEVVTAYDSMCCIADVDFTLVWKGKQRDFWDDSAPEQDTVFICAPSADIDYSEDYKDAVLLSTGERLLDESN